MNILHTTTSLSVDKGGPPRSVTNLASAIADLGHSVSVLATEDRRSSAEILLPGNKAVAVDVTPHGAFFFSMPYARQLKKNLSDKKIDIVHDHGAWLATNLHASRLSKASGALFVLSTRGVLLPWSLKRRRFKKQVSLAVYQRNIFQNTELLFATSYEEVEALRKFGLEQPVAMIPNGITMPNLTIEDRENRVPQKKKRLCFLSRIHPVKGLENLIAAWSKCRIPGWEIVIAGNDEGGHKKSIEREIAKYSLASEIRFVGPMEGEQKKRFFLESDVFILPTFSENFGIVIAEALSHGVPVITTTGTPWQEITEVGCGWIAEPNFTSIAEAISKALSISDAERLRMGARGRELIQSKYTWDRVAMDTVVAYNWSLEKGEKPSFIHTI